MEALGAIAKRTPLGIADLVGQDENRIDDSPDDGADEARDDSDDELCDPQPGLAEIDPADADDPEQSQQLQQSGDDLGLVGQRFARERMATVGRGRIGVGRRVLAGRRRI